MNAPANATALPPQSPLPALPVREALTIRRPIVFAALAHLGGLASGISWSIPAWPVLALALLMLLAAASNLWRARRMHGPPLGAGWTLLVALAAIGAWQGGSLMRNDAAARANVAPLLGEQLVRVEGIVDGEPRLREHDVRILLRDATVTSMKVGGESRHLLGRVVVSLRGEAERSRAAAGIPLPLPGQSLRIWGSLSGPRAPTTPSLFDAERYWQSQGIVAGIAASESGSIEYADAPNGPRAALQRAMRRMRATVVRQFEKYMDRSSVPLARALLLGEAELIDPETNARYKSSGLAHLLAVSGQQTSFLLVIVLVFARLIGLGPRAGIWIGLPALIFYTALTGFMPAIMRASVMGAFLMFAFTIGRVTTGAAALATAAFVTLVFDPRNLLRVDWQLSYLCVLAMVLAASPIYELLARGGIEQSLDADPEHRFPRWRTLLNRLLILPFSVILAVQIVLLPVQIAYFHQLFLLNAASNMVAIPASFAALLGLVLTSTLGLVPGLGFLLGRATQFFLDFMSSSVDIFSAMHFGMINRPPLPFWSVMIYYGLLLSGSWLRTGRAAEFLSDRRQRWNLTLTLGLLAALLVWTPSGKTRAALPNNGKASATTETLDLYMLDVGQGDGLVIRFPNGRIMVVDGGPGDSGRHVIAPLLQRLGVQRIDYLVATHADADHIGGLPFLVETFEIGLMIESNDTADSALFSKLEAAERDHALQVERGRWHETITGIEPVSIRLLGPVPGLDNNDASVVMLISYGDADFLLTGDLEASGERRIVAEGLATDVEVLKVGHHGSRTSSSEEFLDRTKPEIALISVGKKNRYNHPSPEVLQRLKTHAVRTLRTDELGTVRVRTNGRQLVVEQFVVN